ncbi:MAG: hypothetical protein EHM65_10445, partial [Acidobacteriales bacterium]
MLSFLQKPSNSTDKSYVRVAYRQRLQEIADSTSYSSTASDGLPGAEAGQPDLQFFSRDSKAKVEETRSEPAVAAAGEVPKDGLSSGGAVTAAPVRPADGIDEFSTKLAQSLTECWSVVLKGLKCQFSLDRDRLQTALTNLDSLSGSVQGVAGALAPLSERADLLDRNYHELGPRLFDAEQRVATSQRGIERLDVELNEVSGICREMQERVRTQGEAIAALEGTLRNQAERIGTQVK